jgi:hypothetical protein
MTPGLEGGIADALKTKKPDWWLLVVGAAIALGSEGKAKLFSQLDPQDCRSEKLLNLLTAIKSNGNVGATMYAATGIEVCEGETPMQALIRSIKSVVLEHRVNVLRCKLGDRSIPAGSFLRRMREELEALEKEIAS